MFIELSNVNLFFPAFQPLGRPVSESESECETTAESTEAAAVADAQDEVPKTPSEETTAVPIPTEKTKIQQSIPEEVPYLIIGAGPAAMAASTSIRGHDAKSKVISHF